MRRARAGSAARGSSCRPPRRLSLPDIRHRCYTSAPTAKASQEVNASVECRGGSMSHWLRERLAERPWWMNVLMVFCAYMALVHIPLDFFVKPLARDGEA